MGVVTRIIQTCIHFGGIYLVNFLYYDNYTWWSENSLPAKSLRLKKDQPWSVNSTQYKGIPCKWSHKTFIEYTLCMSWFFGGERISKMSNMTVAYHDEEHLNLSWK